MSELRIGLGVDAHRFADGIPLVLAGVDFPGEPGLAGHSDGDVIAHALIDAILGAAGKGDIGELFPSSDPQWLDASSIRLLQRSYEVVRVAGFELVNADCVLIGERPKIADVAGRDGRAPRRRDGRRHRPRHGSRDDHRRARLHGPRRRARRPGGRASATIGLRWPFTSRPAPSGPARSRTRRASRAPGPSSCTTTRS